MKYYLFIEEQAQGPYDLAEIREMIYKRTISTETLAQKEGDDGKWVLVSSLPFKAVDPTAPAVAAEEDK